MEFIQLNQQNILNRGQVCQRIMQESTLLSRYHKYFELKTQKDSIVQIINSAKQNLDQVKQACLSRSIEVKDNIYQVESINILSAFVEGMQRKMRQRRRRSRPG